MNDAGAFQASLGKRLLDDGWRQCSLVRPDPAHLDMIPAHLGFDASRERMMLVTQSCSICGVSRNNERFVEAMVVQMLPKILPDHNQARKGAVVRNLVLAVSNSLNYEGILCDIDRRCFIPRELLAGWSRDEVNVVSEELAAFQGWMAKYYARVAVPTELVKRFERSGFQEAMKTALKRHFNKNGTGLRVHEVVDRIYIDWEPDDELPIGDTYDVSLIIACKFEFEHLVDDVAEQILKVPHFSNDQLSLEGIKMDAPDFFWIGNLTFGAIHGFRRLGTWDALTGLEDYTSAIKTD
jgi:hypothetical protein